jgi:DNA-binding CsgD family transcriptional regulator
VGETWPLVGRARELTIVETAVRRGHGGLVISGEAGTGKSRLADEAMALAEKAGAVCERVIGTKALSLVPLGAFAPLLSSNDAASLSRADNRADLLRRCCETLEAVAGDKPFVLVVDDAHLVDDISVSLLHQLLGSSSCLVIACVEAGVPSEEMTSLWKDDRVDRLDLRGLDLDAVGELLEAVLDGPVDPATVHRLADVADGSLVFLRELVVAAMAQGSLSKDIGVWRLGAAPLSSNRMTELVEARFSDLDLHQRSVLELVAFGEPLTLGELPGVEARTIADLERRSILVTAADGDRTSIRLAQTVYGQVLRERTPALRAREIARELGDAIEATGMRRRDDLLRVATWRLEGGDSSPGLMLAAARMARTRYDFALAERLARRAVHLGAGFDASFLTAQVVGQLGRREEAEKELSVLADAASDDRQRGLVAAARLDNLVFDLGRVHLGLHMAMEAEASITDPVWKAEITAKRASVLSGVVGPRAGAEVALPVVESADGRALVWASIVASYALGRLGNLEQAREISMRGHVAQLGLEEPRDWFPWRLVFFEAEALGHLGRLDESERLALAMYHEALDEGSLEAQAWFAWQMTKFVLDRGYPDTAARYGRLAVALFRQLGAAQYEQFALGHLAAAFAIGGKRRESRETLQFMDDQGLPSSNYWTVDVLQARGWTAALHGDLPAALSFLHEGARVGDEIGDLVGAAASLHGLARMGSFNGVVPQLEQHAKEIEGPMVQARLAHVRALVAKSGADLEAVSTTFSGLGAHLLAAEAAADAAVAWRDHGDGRKATAASRNAAALADRCERPVTPALNGARAAAHLTPAERTTALLAANGRTSREIAEELVVSVRTVENHLQRVYEKLGIRGRAELRVAVEQSLES